MPDIHIADYRHEVEKSLVQAEAVDIAVAFASGQGLSFGQVETQVLSILKNGGQVRLLIDLRIGFTHPAFIQQVLEWQEQGLPIHCRHYSKEHGLFHPKLYLFRLSDGRIRAVTGSANWTAEAFTVNVEHGVVVEGESKDPILQQMQQFFDALWDSDEAKVVDAIVLAEYHSYWKQQRGAERRTRRKATKSWRKIEKVLLSAQRGLLSRWPSKDVAFLLGVVSARGEIDRETAVITVQLLHGGSLLMHDGRSGYIGKGRVGFPVTEVSSAVRTAIVERISKIVARDSIRVESRGKRAHVISLDCQQNPEIIEDMWIIFEETMHYSTVPVPQIILNAAPELKREFLRGHGLTCALVSSGTYTPGVEQVWLRPNKPNQRQFQQLVGLLNELDIAPYEHQRLRESREPHIKVRCEDWLSISFGVQQLDSIVQEGARLNGSLQE